MQVRMGWWKTNHRASQSRTLRSGDRTGKGGRNLFVWCLQSHLDCRECLNEFLVERKVWVMVQSIDCLLPVLATIPVTCDRLFQRFILLHPTSCWRFPLIAPHIDRTAAKQTGNFTPHLLFMSSSTRRQLSCFFLFSPFSFLLHRSLPLTQCSMQKCKCSVCKLFISNKTPRTIEQIKQQTVKTLQQSVAFWEQAGVLCSSFSLSLPLHVFVGFFY